MQRPLTRRKFLQAAAACPAIDFSIAYRPAKLVWSAPGGILLPTNNLDARACVCVGALKDGVLHGNGEIVRVQFTRAGGQPTNGQTWWLARNDDDGAPGGMGKATATAPPLVWTPVNNFDWRQNRAPAGTVVDASHYPINRTALVQLATPSSPFVGSPISPRNIADKFIDTKKTFYDSFFYPWPSVGSRLAFSVPTLADLQAISVGCVVADLDGGDQFAFAWFVNGNLQQILDIGMVNDNQVHYYALADHLATLGAPPYNVEIVSDYKLQRGATFQSGGVITDFIGSGHETWVTSACSRRLVIVGDGDTDGFNAGSQGCCMQNSAATIMRKDYPGRITLCTTETSGMVGVDTGIIEWGNGSVIPFAYQIQECAQEGSPGIVDLLFMQGFRSDYFVPESRPARFAQLYGQLLDKVHELMPAANIFVGKMIQVHYDAIANGNGDTVADFNAAIDGLASGRSWLHVVDLRTPNTIIFSDSTGIQINPTMYTGGTAALAANIKAAIGY